MNVTIACRIGKFYPRVALFLFLLFSFVFSLGGKRESVGKNFACIFFDMPSFSNKRVLVSSTIFSLAFFLFGSLSVHLFNLCTRSFARSIRLVKLCISLSIACAFLLYSGNFSTCSMNSRMWDAQSTASSVNGTDSRI